MSACELGNTNLADALLTAGSDPNVKDKINRTALLFAAKKGSTECAKLCLAFGANVL